MKLTKYNTRLVPVEFDQLQQNSIVLAVDHSGCESLTYVGCIDNNTVYLESLVAPDSDPHWAHISELPDYFTGFYELEAK